MSSPSIHQTMATSALPQPASQTDAHSATQFATKADIAEVKASIEKLGTGQQRIEALLVLLLQDRAALSQAAQNYKTSTATTSHAATMATAKPNIHHATQSDSVAFPQEIVKEAQQEHVAFTSMGQDASLFHQSIANASVVEAAADTADQTSGRNTAARPSKSAEPTAHAPDQDTVSATSTDQAKEDTLSSEELIELQTLPQQSTRLLCVSEPLRYKTVITLYCALKSRNPAPSSCRTRLSESQMIQMTRHAEFQILIGIDREIVRKTMSHTSSIILNEYSTRRQRLWGNYKHSESFSVLVRGFQQFVRKSMRRGRRSRQQQYPQQVGTMANRVCGRAGYCYRLTTLPANPHHVTNAPQNVPVTGINQGVNHSVPIAQQTSRRPEEALLGGSRSGSQQSTENGPSSGISWTIPATQVPKSDMLIDADFALLKEPASVAPYDLEVDNDSRRDTLVGFYDTLVDANTRLSRLKHNEGLEPELVKVYRVTGTAPLWNDFTPLATKELFCLAKRIEDHILSILLEGVRSERLDGAHENKYLSLTTRYSPRSDVLGLRSFALMAAKLLDPMEV